MPSFFSKLKTKDGAAKISKKRAGEQAMAYEPPPQPRWEDAWTRKSVQPEEVQELLRGCTIELKSRALDMPFLLLPFRPTSDPSAARSFIRNFFERGQHMHGEVLAQELRLTEPMVLCSVVKWCWSRLPGGVVSWDAYELFKVGESDSYMARDSFATFIPLSVDSDARTKIIFDFFDLLSAIAAHGKTNGLGGRKLSRLAGWWAFEHDNLESGFEGGYRVWATAADATSHLFFAYLRSLSPESVKGPNGISTLPISLQKLVQETEYPPERPSLLQSSTTKVVMIVDSVSPTPFALLRRANHFQYRDDDRALQEFAEYDDPVQALTDECRRVLKSISSANQSQVSTSKDSTGLRDASWSRFEDIGFSGAYDENDYDDDSSFVKVRNLQSLRATPHSKSVGMGIARPTTPSWADFLSSGFVDEATNNPPPLLLPPDKILPPIDTRGRSSQSHRPRLESDRNLEPGELASITRFDLDDSFWWVWISSLAGEEPAERKAAFGRCALVETVIRGGRWLVMEEMVKGAAPEPAKGAYIAEKKSFWGRSKKNKGMTRSKSTGKQALEIASNGRPPFNSSQSVGYSKTSIGPDQHARIQAAAIQLQQRQRLQDSLQPEGRRRARDMDMVSQKTSSIFTLQPVIMSEASPAMKWANKYDKDAIREAYLANVNNGRSLGDSTMQTSSQNQSQDTLRPTQNLLRGNSQERELPAIPSSAAPAVPRRDPKPIADEEEYVLVQSPTKAAEVAPLQDLLSNKQKALPVPSSPIQPSSTDPRPSMDPRPSIDRYAESGSSPESRAKHNRLRKREAAAAGGFRKMFGRNKNRQSKVPESAPEVLNGDPGGLQRVGSRFSSFRRKSPAASPVSDMSPGFPPQAANVEDDEVTPYEVTHDEVTPVASPTNPNPYDRSYDPSIRDSLSRVSTADANEASRAFSSFDQGPLQDVPAFVPDDSPRQSEESDRAAPPPISRNRSDDGTGAPLTTKMSNPAQDRWAQIRKDAAERAALRQSEDQDRGDYGNNDGDSEQESIESRVARIKAHIAQLTVNMETGRLPADRIPVRR